MLRRILYTSGGSPPPSRSFPGRRRISPTVPGRSTSSNQQYRTTIADRFDIDINLLMVANASAIRPDLRSARLVIPGLEKVTGILDTEIVNGDSFELRPPHKSSQLLATQPCR
jgi:hypothetical protein